jgi:hypothetical protein
MPPERAPVRGTVACMSFERSDLGRWFILGAIVAACSSTTGQSPTGTGTTSSQQIGPAGGSVHFEGATLDVPAGAVTADTTITITSSTGSAPSGTTASSPIYVFGPEGLTFSKAATVHIDFTGSGTHAAIMWSKVGGVGFDSLSTSVQGQTAASPVTHFSQGFVADVSSVGMGTGGVSGSTGGVTGAGGLTAAGGSMAAGGAGGLRATGGSMSAGGAGGSMSAGGAGGGCSTAFCPILGAGTVCCTAGKCGILSGSVCQVAGGAGGAGGAAGAGGASAAGGAGGAPSCNAAFCPSAGSGAPCCKANGSCGTNLGSGCQ